MRKQNHPATGQEFVPSRQQSGILQNIDLMRLREFGWLVSAVLGGFGLGLSADEAFFWPPGSGHNGIAEFAASTCILVSLASLALIRLAGLGKKGGTYKKQDA